MSIQNLSQLEISITTFNNNFVLTKELIPMNGSTTDFHPIYRDSTGANSGLYAIVDPAEQAPGEGNILLIGVSIT